MRIRKMSGGYRLNLSANDTYLWATKPGAAWPCSELRGRRLMVEVDSNGLCDITIDGEAGDVSGHELEACINDHLPKDCRRFWPVWEFTPAQTGVTD